MVNDDDSGAVEDAIDIARTAPATQPGVTGDGIAPPLDVVANRYEIRSLLGVGGMGRVYRAYDRSLDEIVALKVLRRELVDAAGMLERFRQEVRLARRVTSPHVVRTFDLGEHGDEHFLTMEYVEGRSLAQLLEDGPLVFEEALRIARGACAGMAAAHEAGVLHRDLKPDNVLVARTGRIAITDFGIARPSASPLETADRYAGTPAYMAPEQVDGIGAIAPPTDVYAFGAILYEMLTGRRAFPGTSLVAVAMARLAQVTPDPRDVRRVPDALAEIVVRCMARDASQRFGNGQELAAALAKLELADPSSTMPRSGPVVPTKSSRTVAILPMRAPADLVEIGDGLAEEIVDALSMTRELRVRPLASVRSAAAAQSDPRDVGKALGVDIVVDGSLRRLGATVRITARVIGVADGFQLWASRFDTEADGLLAVGDDIARAVANALTIDIPLEATPVRDARATERYLEGKAKLRLAWREARLETAIVDLEAAIAIAPDEPDMLAALAMALARMSFQNRIQSLPRAIELAERAVALGPSSGEAWLALGLARLYSGRPIEAGFAAARAVKRSPGLAPAQSMLGSLLLEAGALDDALAHLEAAYAVDPLTEALWDLARAHAYAGNFELAAERVRLSPHARYYSTTQLARFRIWQGVPYDEPIPDIPPGIAPILEQFSAAFLRTARTRIYEDEMRDISHVDSPRLRAALGQMLAEVAMFANEPAQALALVETCVASGLQDLLWIERCPLLAPLAAEPRYQAAAASVRARAEAVLSSVRAGLQDGSPSR